MSLALYNHKALRGSYQTNLQSTATGVMVKFNSPACFHVVTPRNNESVFLFKRVGTTTPPVYAPTVETTFTRPSVQELTTGDSASAGMPEHNFWAQSNDDSLQGKYYLQSINFTFTVGALFNQPKAIRFRVDFVVPNKSAMFRAVAGSLPLGIDQSNYKLPDAFGSFNAILGIRNRVNPLYWKFVRKPVYFTVAPGPMVGLEGATAPTPPASGAVPKSLYRTVQKHVKLNINKLYNPRDVGTTAADQGSAYLSIPDYQQMWCVISNDAPESTDGLNTDRITPNIFITRQFSWRDRAGHAV